MEQDDQVMPEQSGSALAEEQSLSPIDVSERQRGGGSRSSVTSDEEEIDMEVCDLQFEEMDRAKNKRESRVYLRHNEALEKLIGSEGPENFLKDWSNDDCAGMLVQLTKNGIDAGGARRLVKFFRDTTADEILGFFNECKEINKRADQRRALLDRSVAEGTKAGTSKRRNSSGNKSYNWKSVMLKAKKSRVVTDKTSEAICEFLMECARQDDKVPDVDCPDYMVIYNSLANIVSGYSVKRLERIDAAIILKIFEQMEEDISSMPEMLAFFKQMFADVHNFSKDEFKLDRDLTEDSAGAALMNTLSIPDELLDLSKFCKDKENS